MFVFPEQYLIFLNNYLITDLINIIDIYYLKTDDFCIDSFKNIKIYNNIEEIPQNCITDNILTQFYEITIDTSVTEQSPVDIKYAYNFWLNIKEIYFYYTELSEDFGLDNSIIGKLKNNKYFKFYINSHNIIDSLVLNNSLSYIVNNYTSNCEMEWFIKFQSK